MNTADFGAVPLNTPFNAGSTFEAEGVISYDFGAYTLIPTQFKLKKAVTLPRAVDKPLPVALRIGSLNTERFCDTTFDTTYTCSGGSSEPTADEVALKTQRLAAYIGGVLRSPDVLSVEEVKSLPLLQGLAKVKIDEAMIELDGTENKAASAPMRSSASASRSPRRPPTRAACRSTAMSAASRRMSCRCR